VKLFIRATAGEPKCHWHLEAEGGGTGYQVHKKEETYLSIGIFNKWRGYSLRIPPEEVKNLRITCEEFLAELREQGWEL